MSSVGLTRLLKAEPGGGRAGGREGGRQAGRERTEGGRGGREKESDGGRGKECLPQLSHPVLDY